MLKQSNKPLKKSLKKEENVTASSSIEIEDLLNEPKLTGYTKGFVLINFPSSLKQARLLEVELTGFQQNIELLNGEGESLKS